MDRARVNVSNSTGKRGLRRGGLCPVICDLWTVCGGMEEAPGTSFPFARFDISRETRGREIESRIDVSEDFRRLLTAKTRAVAGAVFEGGLKKSVHSAGHQSIRHMEKPPRDNGAKIERILSTSFPFRNSRRSRHDTKRGYVSWRVGCREGTAGVARRRMRDSRHDRKRVFLSCPARNRKAATSRREPPHPTRPA
jgi:hypothetical protein